MTLQLQHPSVASEMVWWRWNLGGVSEITGIPKKHLRKAFDIVSAPKVTTQILRRGNLVDVVFFYGFMKYTIKEKHKKRKIVEPHPDVQKVYRLLKEWLEGITCAHKQAFGFVKEKNAKGAAEELKALFSCKGGGYHYSFDIADAFPSVKDDMVQKMLVRLGIEESIAKTLAWFVTHNYQGCRRLPQGSSVSPILLNLVYKPMCEEIDAMCKRNRINWSVYVDDFNFAGEYITEEVKEVLFKIPVKYGLRINPKKTKDNLGKTIPHLLGLTVVDGKLHISRKQKKKFRAMLYMAMRYQAYSPEVVRGIRGYIKHAYGEEKNWPGWLKKVGGVK